MVTGLRRVVIWVGGITAGRGTWEAHGGLVRLPGVGGGHVSMFIS